MPGTAKEIDQMAPFDLWKLGVSLKCQNAYILITPQIIVSSDLEHWNGKGIVSFIMRREREREGGGG